MSQGERQFDREIQEIADYVDRFDARRPAALDAAYHCLVDGLGCAFMALAYPDCTKLLGPIARGMIMPNGARVPGTSFVLDPVQAAFNMATLVRWLEFNDATWGETVSHPSDTLVALLVVADWVSRERRAQGRAPLLIQDVLELGIKAYELQGQLGILNPFRRFGLDHTIVVKIAATATVAKLVGCSRDEIVSAVSNAWLDGHALATFRSEFNTGSRKSWAGGDAAARGVWLALIALRGEMGYPTALSATTWGFCDVLLKGRRLQLPQPYGTYIVENILFKVPSPTAFHAQTAVEAAIRLNDIVKNRLDDIRTVEIWSHASCLMILNKTGPLHNAADRDHCLQYTVAVPLIFGHLAPEDYRDEFAADPRIDLLRAKMEVKEEPRFTAGYNDLQVRSNAHAIQVRFNDGTSTDRVEVPFPCGHPTRRDVGIPLVFDKFRRGLATVFAEKQRHAIESAFADRARLASMPVNEVLDLMVL
jgi:2-methylcitrate dehydratase